MMIEQFSLLNACKPRTTDLRPFDGKLAAEPWPWSTPHGGSSEHSPREIAVRRIFKVLTGEIISPREIAVRRIFKVLTGEIISRGESPRSHTGRAVDGVNNTPLCACF